MAVRFSSWTEAHLTYKADATFYIEQEITLLNYELIYLLFFFFNTCKKKKELISLTFDQPLPKSQTSLLFGFNLRKQKLPISFSLSLCLSLSILALSCQNHLLSLCYKSAITLSRNINAFFLIDSEVVVLKIQSRDTQGNPGPSRRSARSNLLP